MLKGFVIGIVFTLAALAAAGYAVLRTGTIPAGADAGPLPFERWAAGTSLHATLVRDAPKGPNPVPLNEANLIAGIQLYAKNCAFCHGPAQGDAAMTPIAQGENPGPPQLATETVTDDPESWTFWKIKNGIRWSGMPAWQGTLNDHQIWTIALFLKHIDKLPPAAQQVWQGVKN